MKQHIHHTELMSNAFCNWFRLLGYVAHATCDGILFVCHVVNKKYPRDVMILRNGKLNKPAKKLFEEFKGYKPFEVV